MILICIILKSITIKNDNLSSINPILIRNIIYIIINSIIMKEGIMCYYLYHNQIIKNIYITELRL